MTLGSGWLPKQPGLAAELHGVYIPRYSIIEHAEFPTRREEYWFVATVLADAPRGTLLDAATGFNPEIHVLPYILGNMGFAVTAIDGNPKVREMPLHRQVLHAQANVLRLPLHMDNSFDYTVCISTLEHMPFDAQHACTMELFRVLKPGGYALFTTDENEPELLQGYFQERGWLVGTTHEFQGEQLEPRVSWAVVQKPT